MRLRLIASTPAAFAALVLSGSAAAHHSYAEFDHCTSVTIDGEIERIEWANPHIVMMIDAGEAGTYRIEWFDLNRLARAGLSTDVLREGQRAAVTGSANRDPDRKIVTLLTEIRTTDGTWSWTQNRARPATCEGAASG